MESNQDGVSDSVSRSNALKLLDDKGKRDTSRRGFLRGSLATVIGAAGFSGTASAVDSTGQFELRKVKRQYKSDAVARKALKAHGQDLFGQLVNRELLTNEEVDRLVAEQPVDVNGVIAADDMATALLRIETEIDQGKLHINVQPEASRQYAVLVSDRSKAEKVTVIDPSNQDSEAALCTYVTACLGSACACEEYNAACCPGSCYLDGTTGTTCCNCATAQRCEYACG